ncbi:hypothetical protein ACFVVM_06190 [Nocardia sp. NPDC058176]|uniref:hypothetical protein n=1 Tax=Nocardia sp. NPDC058176 TaxID=3346368 RepID=UPI0036D96953
MSRRAGERRVEFNGTVNQLLHRLPDIATLRDRCRAMAMIDAVLSPDWESRYYSFNSAWGESEELASMRNGSGDDWFIVFSAAGVYGRGFDHESPNAPHVLDAVPAAFGAFVTEPAFADHDGSPLATVCFWRGHDDTEWSVSTADHGGRALFELVIEGTPEAYRDWAQDYYETEVSLSAVHHVFALRPLTPEVVGELNPDVAFGDLAGDLVEIGYPDESACATPSSGPA